jgi:streptomycin 6-kinase
MLWTTAPGAAVGCVSGDLFADRRRGRVLMIEGDGTIRVLSDSGESLLVEKALAAAGKSVRSGVTFDSVLSESDGTSALADLYYAGTNDGNLYVVRVARGGCP